MFGNTDSLVTGMTSDFRHSSTSLIPYVLWCGAAISLLRWAINGSTDVLGRIEETEANSVPHLLTAIPSIRSLANDAHRECSTSGDAWPLSLVSCRLHPTPGAISRTFPKAAE